MTTRNVVGVIRYANGNPWVGARLRFHLIPGSYTDDDQVPQSSVTATADVAGEILVPLWINEEGEIATEYRVDEPGGETYFITVPAGVGDLELSEARTLYAGPSDPNFENLSTYVDSLIDPIEAGLAAHVADVANPHAVTKAQLGLANVENTALSTWAGSANITTVGTLTSLSIGGAGGATSLTATANVVLGQSGFFPVVRHALNDQGLIFSAGITASQGANITLYGPSHATDPNVTRFRAAGTETWRMTAAGILQAPGAQTIQTATGALTLATAAGNGDVIVSPHGTGRLRFGTFTAIGAETLAGSLEVKDAAGTTRKLAVIA